MTRQVQVQVQVCQLSEWEWMRWFGGLGGADFLHPGLVAQAEESAGERGVQARVTFFRAGQNPDKSTAPLQNLFATS